MAYDDANANVRREHCVGEVGGAATTVYGKFHHFQKMKLNAVHFRITGTATDTDHKVDVYIGTTSVASAALARQAIGVTSSVTIGSNVTALQAVEVKTGADTVGKAVVSYEFEVDPDAVRT
jgi:hypothetical protein